MPPPKKDAPKPSNKTHQKKMEQMVADKTFGMKKTKANAKMKQQLESQVNNSKAAAQAAAAKKKQAEKDDARDLSKIFKPVQDMPKLAADVDPKSVLCVFFKQGLCTKGKKCKFSHDLSVQQKTAKRNLYVDSRDIKKDEEERAKETSENWDEAQIQDVAEKKHGADDRKRPNQTNIICKYFLAAVESGHYGWFWSCPSGETCIYRHALPPGYVLTKDRKKMDEQKRLEQISLDELIEKERANLSTKTQTKVTLETFIAWKKKKIVEKRKRDADDENRKRSDYKTGQKANVTGREMFLYDPKMNEDEQDDEGGSVWVREKEADNPDEPKAFVIDERTFYNIGEDGKMLDDDMDELAAAANEGELSKVVIDASVFNPDDAEDLPDTDDDDEEEGEDVTAAGPSNGATTNIEADINSKLKL